MNDENKNGLLGEENSAPEKEENTASEANEEAALNEELESLRDTFQEKYDETVEEAASMPVIQELEEGEEEEESEEEEDETPAHSQAKARVKAPRKKMKRGKLAAIIIAAVLLITVVGSLAAFMVASVTNPNFSSFISAYAQASAAEDYEDKMTYLEQALTYCSDKDSAFQAAMALTIHEEIAVAVYEEEGFEAAYSYIQSKMTEEQIKNPASSEFRKLTNVIKAVNSASLQVFSKVYENLGDAESAPAYAVLAEGLSIPEDLEDAFEDILKSVAQGYILNRTSEGVEDSLVAMNYYANAYSALISLGADSAALAEKMCVELYNKGYVLEAVSFSSVAVDPEKTDFSKDYEAFKTEIAAYADADISVVLAAEELVAEEKTSKEDVAAFVAEYEALTEKQASIITDIIMYAIEAVEAENAKNLTDASSIYATVTSVLEAFGMDDVNAHIKTAAAIFNTGNLSDASTLITTYLTEEKMADATDEQKAEYDRMSDVIAALNATSEIFSPYYSAYYQYGTAIDAEELEEKLDELLDNTEGNGVYMEGFACYCLYIATISNGNTEKASVYLDAMSTLMPDLPFIYGYSYIADYIENGNFTAAYNYASKLLDVNIADEYANSILSLYARVKGDLDAAAEAALKGAEYAGSTTGDCAQQLVIVYMLKGEFEDAFSYLSGFYSAAQTMESYELVLIFNALYEGDNADIKAALAEMVSVVNQTYSYYGITSYAETTAIIDGTKTLKDVFMAGDYTITAE